MMKMRNLGTKMVSLKSRVRMLLGENRFKQIIINNLNQKPKK